MPMLALNLVVLRSADLNLAVKFYSCLGLEFSEHQHSNGPPHFAAELSGCVFELYPQTPQAAPSTGARIGFSVTSMKAALSALVQFPNCIHSGPKISPWGLRAVLTDPDGHRVELLEQSDSSG